MGKTTSSLEPTRSRSSRSARRRAKNPLRTALTPTRHRYYLHFPIRFFSGRWELSLRRGGPQGPEICQIRKGGSWSNSFELHWTYVLALYRFSVCVPPD